MLLRATSSSWLMTAILLFILSTALPQILGLQADGNSGLLEDLSNDLLAPGELDAECRSLPPTSPPAAVPPSAVSVDWELEPESSGLPSAPPPATVPPSAVSVDGELEPEFSALLSESPPAAVPPSAVSVDWELEPESSVLPSAPPPATVHPTPVSRVHRVKELTFYALVPASAPHEVPVSFPLKELISNGTDPPPAVAQTEPSNRSARNAHYTEGKHEIHVSGLSKIHHHGKEQPKGGDHKEDLGKIVQLTTSSNSAEGKSTHKCDDCKKSGADHGHNSHNRDTPKTSASLNAIIRRKRGIVEDEPYGGMLARTLFRFKRSAELVEGDVDKKNITHHDTIRLSKIDENGKRRHIHALRVKSANGERNEDIPNLRHLIVPIPHQIFVKKRTRMPDVKVKSNEEHTTKAHLDGKKIVEKKRKRETVFDRDIDEDGIPGSKKMSRGKMFIMSKVKRRAHDDLQDYRARRIKQVKRAAHSAAKPTKVSEVDDKKDPPLANANEKGLKFARSIKTVSRKEKRNSNQVDTSLEKKRAGRSFPIVSKVVDSASMLFT